MQKENLIKKLQELPDGTEVVIMDINKNLSNDDPDGSSEGIFPDFDVEVMQNANPEKKQFISLGFTR